MYLHVQSSLWLSDNVCLHFVVYMCFNDMSLWVFQGMGESNCAWNRKPILHRDTLLAAAAIYKGEVAWQHDVNTLATS